MRKLVLLLLLLGLASPVAATTASFTGIDRTTGKVWQGTYGTNGYACWPDGGGTQNFPTSFVRGAGSQYRFEGFGVCQGFYNRTADGVDFRIGLSLTTPQTVRFRMCDLPAGFNRVTQVDVYQDDGAVVTEVGSLGVPHANGRLLDTRLVDNYVSCVYPGWSVDGPVIFKFTAIEPHLYPDGRTITDTNGLAVFSGIFLDPPTQVSVPPVVAHCMDSDTSTYLVGTELRICGEPPAPTFYADGSPQVIDGYHVYLDGVLVASPVETNGLIITPLGAPALGTHVAELAAFNVAGDSPRAAVSFTIVAPTPPPPPPIIVPPPAPKNIRIFGVNSCTAQSDGSVVCVVP